MKTYRTFTLLLTLLVLATACKKDNDKGPSKTALLTAKAWKDSNQTLKLNTVEGTRTLAAADLNYYQFGTDGKFTVGALNGSPSSASTGTWSFANNETQITLVSGNTTNTFDLFELSADRFSFGYNYSQAQIQQATSGNGGNTGPAAMLPLLLLSAGSFTFPANTPTIPTSQLTSVQWKNNAVPR